MVPQVSSTLYIGTLSSEDGDSWFIFDESEKVYDVLREKVFNLNISIYTDLMKLEEIK